MRSPSTAPSRRPSAAVFLVCVWLAVAVGAAAEETTGEVPVRGGEQAGWRWADPAWEPVHSISMFGGEGTERNFSDTVRHLFNFKGSTDRILAVALGRRIAWMDDRLSVDSEIFYARHYGRERYHEVGATAYLRWHDFPWREHVVTSFAVGVGPSYTTILPQLEVQDDGGSQSRILNQFNLELTLAPPQYRETALVMRLQHRSGVFGLINGVTDASNFLTIGLRYDF